MAMVEPAGVEDRLGEQWVSLAQQVSVSTYCRPVDFTGSCRFNGNTWSILKILIEFLISWIIVGDKERFALMVKG
ncbi:hypothetical protein N7478_010138 [Penicillium angulare]|uniref:uncharacterized protein n=1 Tax=Penicillium angulare TaxID=116970 RepID=UPI002541DA35|nr:uncharacterized protein N7478_010138 [Penicillium angulare]KAJ5267330.1 hypothetical protein N7478_010138 [Penicillium angulare]